MKALMWKAVFATLNPSPVFEAVAIFGEELAINGNGLPPNEIRTAVVKSHTEFESFIGTREGFPSPGESVKGSLIGG